LGQAEPIDSVLKVTAIDLVVVAEYKAARQAKRARFHHLLSRPLSRGVACDIEMEGSSPVDAQHEKDVDDVEGDGGHDRKVDGQGLVQVVVEESFPGLTVGGLTKWHKGPD